MKIVGKTSTDIQNEERKKELENSIIESQKYLDSTDRNVVRSYETGEPIFETIVAKRKECKATINSAKAELEKIK